MLARDKILTVHKKCIHIELCFLFAYTVDSVSPRVLPPPQPTSYPEWKLQLLKKISVKIYFTILDVFEFSNNSHEVFWIIRYPKTAMQWLCLENFVDVILRAILQDFWMIVFKTKQVQAPYNNQGMQQPPPYISPTAPQDVSSGQSYKKGMAFWVRVCEIRHWWGL